MAEAKTDNQRTDPARKGADSEGNVAFVSNTFDRSLVGTYRLSFSVSDDGVDYAILNDNREVLLLKSYQNERNLPRNEFLDQIAFSDEILKENFKGVDLVVHTKRWLLVPAEHYTEGCEPLFLETIHPVERDQDHFAHDHLKTLSLYVVFAINQQLYKRCQFYFKQFTFHHVAAPLLLESQRVHTALGQRASVHITLFDSHFYCTVFGDNGLLLCNEFTAKHPQDVLFYVMSVVQNMTLNPEDTAIYLTGRGKLKQDSTELLGEYFRHMVNAEQHFQRQPALNKAGLHHQQFVHLLFRNV